MTEEFRLTETQDWFSHNAEKWKVWFDMIKTPNPRALEVGSWEGRSAIFTLQNLCAKSGEIVCIDHFDLFHTEAGKARHESMLYNLEQLGKPFRIIAEFSLPGLMTLLSEATTEKAPGFNWIYIDGSHEADDTFLDAELAWKLARDGSIICFDDYQWSTEPMNSIHHPKRGVDAFLKLHDGQFTQLSNAHDYQMVIQKRSVMRIGFLLSDRLETPSEAFEYGINIAMAADSAYAAPAAVALCSLVQKTPGRITIYVVDCGLQEEDRARIEKSVPCRDNVTINFLPLKGNFMHSSGKWAKIYMLDILPVERALILDADILIRSSVQELWDSRLDKKAIGAVVDVGYPYGHGHDKKRYFNAGVLLADLAQIRKNVSKLQENAKDFVHSKFQDQDLLNAHFDSEWKELSLKWNAQGLGTYAAMDSEDRRVLRLEEMDNPNVVHFTGLVHPPIVEVLSPYLQPYTAKPWGYAGSPGHPFAEEWWAILEQTDYRGLRDTKEWQQECELKKAEAERACIAEFREKIS